VNHKEIFLDFFPADNFCDIFPEIFNRPAPVFIRHISRNHESLNLPRPPAEVPIEESCGPSPDQGSERSVWTLWTRREAELPFASDDLSHVRERDISPLLKTPAEILVHKSSERAGLYLFSLNHRISGVIIRKNAEPGRYNCVFSGVNG